MKPLALWFKQSDSGTVGADPERTLRRLYLNLFLRSRSLGKQKKDKPPTSVAQRLFLSLLIYALFGLLSLYLRHQSVFTLSAYLHSMSFVMLSLFVAASAGEVLFNKDEADILLHRPVTASTLLRAKVSVLLQVCLWLAGALNLVGFFVGATMRGSGWLFLPVHALSTVIEAFFCTGTVVVSYQLCLKWFGRERLDNLMTAMQVLMTIAMVAGGQLLPRFFATLGGSISLNAHTWWLGLFPPLWFACLDDALVGSGDLAALGLALVGVLVTAAMLWLAFRVLARDYEEGLRNIQETVSRKPLQNGRRSWLLRVTDLPPFSWWLRTGVDRSAFLLITAYLFRDRDVKLRVYPGLAPVLVMPIIMVFSGRQGSGLGSASHFMTAFCGCYVGMIPFLALSMLRFSQNWQAAEIFRAAPMEGPGRLCHGARRAVLFLLTAPLVLLMIAGLSLLGLKAEGLLFLLPGLILVPVYSMIPAALQGFVPLAEPSDQAQGSSRNAVVIITMLGSMAFAGLSVLAWNLGVFAWYIVGELILVTVIYSSLRARVSRLAWDHVV